MDSNLKFKLELEELMSGMVRKMGGVTHSVFEGIDRDIAGTQRNLNALGQEVRVRVDTSGIRQAHDDLNRLNDKMGFMATTGAVALGNMVTSGIQRGAAFLKNQAGDVLSSGMAGAMNKMQFEVMVGDAAGDKLFGDLNKYVAETILGTEQFGLGKTLLNYSVGVKEVMPDLKMLADVTSGDTEHLKSMTLAFGQMSAAGHLMGQDLNQFIAAGFNPLQEMARTTGKSYESLRDLMESGGISAKMVRDAFISATSEGGRFYHMLDRIGETAGGKYQADLGNIDMAKQNLGMALLPSVSHFLDTMKPIIDELPANLLKMQPGIDHMIGSLGDMVKWTANNTETIGKFFGVVKVGVEAWAAYKIGTVALTAANWLWVSSVSGQTTAAVAATAAMAEEDAAILAQTASVEGLTIAWAEMGTAARAAMLAQSEAAFALPINVAGATGAMTGAGSAAMAGGLTGLVSKTVVPVAIAYFAGEALAQWMGAGKKGSTFQNVLGYDDHGESVSWYDVLGRNQAKVRRSELRRAGYDQDATMQYMMSGVNPKAGVNGIDMDALAGFGISAATNSKVLDKYGVGPSTAGTKAPVNSTDSESITGGGARTININFRSFVEHMHNGVASNGDAINMTEAQLRGMLARLLGGIPS